MSQRSPLPRLLRLAVVALACALAAPSARAQLSAPTTAQRTMPNVVGMSAGDALGRLRQLGLQVDTRELASQEPRGTVVRQSPQAGTAIRQGVSATLSVSSGPSRTNQGETGGQTQPADGRTEGGVDARPQQGLVPDLSGMSLTMARIRLLTGGLRAGRVDSGSVRGARGGRVIAQDPAAGTQVAPGRSVNLTLQRRGPEAGTQAVDSTPTPKPPPPPPPPPRASTRVAVPDLSGRTVAEARTVVGRARLLLGGVDSATTSTGRVGSVVGQRPAAGDSVEPGTLVSITVARQALVVVPRLAGRSPAEARRELARAQLRAGSMTEREAPGQPGIVGQSVPAGSRVSPGTVVELVVSRAPVVPADTPATGGPAPVPPPAPVVDSVATPRQPVVVPVDSVTAAPPLAAPAESASTAVIPAPPPAPPVAARVDTPVGTRAESPGRTVRWEWLAIVAALLLAAAGAIYLRSRTGRRPAPSPRPAAASPIPSVVAVRTGGRGASTGTNPETPVGKGRVRVGLIMGETPAPEPEPGAAALRGARLMVRLAEEVRPAEEGELPARVIANAAPAEVRATAAEPVLERDEGAVILKRR